MDSISTTDREEAYAIGEKAIEMSQSDMSEIILTIIRSEQPTYGYSIESADLKKVAGKTKYLPEEYRPNKQGDTSDLFKSYLQPLLGNPVYDTKPIFNLHWNWLNYRSNVRFFHKLNSRSLSRVAEGLALRRPATDF